MLGKESDAFGKGIQLGGGGTKSTDLWQEGMGGSRQDGRGGMGEKKGGRREVR